MAEDWVKDAHSKAKAEFSAWSEIEKEVGTLKKTKQNCPSN